MWLLKKGKCVDSVFLHEIHHYLHRVVRAMPNTPCTIGAAASAYVLGSHATQEDGRVVHALLSAVGLAMPVEERMMNAGM